jgi:hypothetical protein
MSDDMISKPRARRIRLISQAGAVVCIAGAVLVVLVGVPFLAKPAVSPIAFSTVQTDAEMIYQSIVDRNAETDVPVAELPADLESIRFSLGSIRNAPVIKTEETADPGPIDPGPPARANSKTRFVGTVGVGDRLLALVSAGGGQRILAEGAEATLAVAPGDDATPPTVRIRGVSASQLMIVEDGTEYTLERAPRVGVSVSTSSASTPQRDPSAPNASPASASAFNDADTVKAVNPDDYRREDGTIDYEALRSAARERARQRQELRRQQRDENGEDN